MNLATARSANRAKEVGLRKVVGAQRKSIIGQFYGESILTAFLAGAVALVLVILLLPAFNALSGKIDDPGRPPEREIPARDPGGHPLHRDRRRKLPGPLPLRPSSPSRS